MNFHKKTTFIHILLILAISVKGYGQQQDNPNQISLGKKFPKIVLTSLDGVEVNTNNLLDKSIVVNFWSVKCKPCIEEIEDLNRLKADYNGVIFLAIALENSERVRELLKKHPFNFIILPDKNNVFKTLKITGFPVTVFVDKKGIVRHIENGAPSIKDPQTGRMKSFAYEHYRYYMPKILK